MPSFDLVLCALAEATEVLTIVPAALSNVTLSYTVVLKFPVVLRDVLNVVVVLCDVLYVVVVLCEVDVACEVLYVVVV